jgi:chromosome segregation ATPase
MDVESEIRDLKRRVGELEGSFGFLSGQVREVHRSLLSFQEETNGRFDAVDARFDRVDARFDGVDARFDRVETRLERVEQAIDELPRALAEVVRAEFERRDRQA